MPTKPETAAMSTAARQNRIEMAGGRDTAPARAPARPPASLAGGVANAFPVAPASARAPTGDGAPALPQRGRGSLSNASGRFEKEARRDENDGWDLPEDLPPLRTQVTRESAKTIVTRNDSPDISFERSINPYRGCEHGCVYCFARPTHAYLGLSPGLDFETRLFAKTNAASLLERELSAPDYAAKTIAIGTNTDPYQPIERKERVMREVLEVLARTNHPVAIVTKSALVLRDLDLLATMAKKGLAKVALSVTTLDPILARKMEPRASSPERRLDAIRRLAEANVPMAVLVAPIIPAINDAEIEAILARAQAMGARDAGYVLLRLPLEVRELFAEWLRAHYPGKLKHVLSLMRSARGGKLYDPRYGARMTGSGPYAWMIGRRFEWRRQDLDLGEAKCRCVAIYSGLRRGRASNCDCFERPCPCRGERRPGGSQAAPTDHQKREAINRRDHGEMAAIDPAAQRSTTIRASAPTIVARVNEPDFSRVADAHPFIWRHLARELANRLRQRVAKVPIRKRKPRVFIASSSEGLKTVEALKAAFGDDNFEVKSWADDIFPAGLTNIEALEAELLRADFAVLFLSPDDEVKSRGIISSAPRDNSILELGLFAGKLGRRRAIMVCPQGIDLKIPTDFLGVNPIKYSATDMVAVTTELCVIFCSLGSK